MSAPAIRTRHQLFVVMGLVVLGFVLRVGVRLASGETAHVESGYGFYRQIALMFLSGHGLCLAPGSGDCAMRPPLYPLFLSAFVESDRFALWVAVLQAAVGASLGWIVFVMARQLFSSTVGLWAAALAACSPYAVIHDTALQETVFVNVLCAAAVSAVLVASDRHRRLDVLAGVLAGAAVLFSVRVLLMACAVPVWLLFSSGGAWQIRVRRASAVLLPMALVVGMWAVRNAVVVGAPVLTTESGASLWWANNEWTFVNFPDRSIDLSASMSLERLSPARAAELERLRSDAVARDRLERSWAVEYIRDYPGETVIRSIRKLWVVVSAEYSPSRSTMTDIGYRAVYVTLNALALLGYWRARRHERVHGVCGAVVAGFLLTTAIFWAHTSHKSVIDSFVFVYAASGAYTLLHGVREERLVARSDDGRI